MYLASYMLRQRGGWILKTLPKAPPFPKRIPLSLVNYINWLVYSLPNYLVSLFLTISIPIIKPLPLTLPIILCFSESLVNSAIR
jgi:hypothetical protein